jgi:hypothetical protein
MRLTAITLDCPDPVRLAEFHRRATGWAPHPASGSAFAALGGEDGPVLGFQRVEDHRAPQWPGQGVPQQMHLDFAVPDLDEVEERLLALGAARPEPQPDAARFRVLLDPAGHPFCLTRR